MTSGGIKPILQAWKSQPVTSPGRGTSNKVWRVIHACEYARDVLPVVEGQLAAGMRPYIVTPQGEGSAELYLAGRQEEPRQLSLLRMWQDVRHWRKSILDCDPENSADLVHAHAFAAGMAAVRGVSCVVYDLEACIEDMAVSSHQVDTGSWMGRSFRVAEQFVLSRAAAVIVHSTGIKAAALERGTPGNNIFLIPDPLPPENEEETFPEDFLDRRFGFAPESIAVYAPDFAGNAATELPPAAVTIFQGFSLAARELPLLRLFVHLPEALARAARNLAEQLRIVDRLCLINQTDDNALMRAAHIIVAGGRVPIDPVLA
ncbi:MAG: glycosyltransferase, partial [Candidatus Angelobacter sp.]